jgi:hypothetical protein
MCCNLESASLKSIPKFINKVVIILNSLLHFSYSISIYGKTAAGINVIIYFLFILHKLFLINYAPAFN